MLPSQYRLPLREMKDFFRTAIKKRFSSFLLYTLPSSLSHPRFVISIKSQGTLAVERNRIKRVVCAALAQHLNTIQPADYVIAVHSRKEENVLKDVNQWLKNTRRIE